MTSSPLPQARPQDVDYLLKVLESVHPLSKELMQEFHKHIMTLQLRKNEILVEQGQICDYVYFILKGAMMGYSVHRQQKITTYISIENTLLSSISGLYGIAPSKETIVAAEDNTILLAMRNDVIQRLYNTYSELNYVVRVMLEEYYKDAQERAYIIRVGNARERYEYFTQTKSARVERLPEDAVASLLNIAPVTLSKLKRQYKTLEIKRQESEPLFRQVDNAIRAGGLYKNKKVSLSSLSANLGVTPHRLSSLINSHCRCSLINYINSCRIDNIKEQLSEPANLKRYTMEVLAYEAGFASRSAFYSAFKKETGLSPAEYLKGLNAH